MSKESDTPRTDAEASEGWSGDAICVSDDFARILERENNRLRAALEELLDMDCRCGGCGCSRVAEKALKEL